MKQHAIRILVKSVQTSPTIITDLESKRPAEKKCNMGMGMMRMISDTC